MCTDLGQHAEPGVSDLGHRGQPEEAVSDWNSLSSIWHKRMAFRKHSKLKLFGTRGCCRPYMEVDCKASLNILTGDLIGTFVKLYDYLLI